MTRRDIVTTFLAIMVWQGTTVAAPPASEARPAAPTRRSGKAAVRTAQLRNQEVQVDRVSSRPVVPVSVSTPVQIRSVGTPSAGAGLAILPAANDLCSSPQTISGSLPIVTPFDTFDTLQAGDGPIHNALIPAGCVDPVFASDGGGMDHDLWYCWTSTVTGPVQVDTCASDGTDTRLAVYNGCGCPTGDTNLRTCNDDGCVASLQSSVSFNAQSGLDYMIRVGRFPGDAGTAGTAGVLTIGRLVPPCTQPGVNCQEPGQAAATDAIRSDVSGGAVDRLVADDFTPTASGDITELCWWGVYVSEVNGQLSSCLDPLLTVGFLDRFSVRYYNDAGGIPGDLIAGPFVMPTCSNDPGRSCTSDADCKTCSAGGAFCQTTLDCGGLGGICEQIATCTDPAMRLTLSEPTQTGFILPLLAPFQEYEYSATHPPVPVTGGDCYWVEISNSSGSGCPWFWEASPTGNGRAYEDDDLLDPPTYEALEFVPGFDTAFCLDVETGDPATACNPPPPPNDDCASVNPQIFDGVTVFDTSGATSAGPDEGGCGFLGNNRIDNDIWFDYVATCSDTLFVDLCGSTFDTRVAVYPGSACPTTSGLQVGCNDDGCGAGADRLQSHVAVNVTAGTTYKIRIGGFRSETGPGEVRIGCGANLCEVAQRDCCSAPERPGPGCNDPVCCDLICSLDPFCCDVVWDDNCATLIAFTSVCDVSHQDCTGDPTICLPGETCITADAANFCPGICSACPDGVGPFGFSDPPNGITDARQPHPIDNAAMLQGFQVFTATAPPGVETTCWQFCSTDASDPNIITGIVENQPGTYTIALANPIKAGATSTIQYTSTTGNTIVTGTYTALPGDVDASGQSNSADLAALIGCLNSGTCFDWECDTDRTGTCSGADVEWAVNLLNGAGQFDSWDQNTPTADQPCP